MKFLLVGKGGREHTLAWKIAQSPRVEKIYAAPGSPGIAEFAECIDIKVDTPIANMEQLRREIARLRDFAVERKIDLTVVGPEDVLTAGIVDHFEEKNLKIFGPTAKAARLESSKAFAKALMERIGVPTASHRTFRDSAAAAAYVREQGAPIVVKASGLATGKGAIVAQTETEALEAISAIMDTRVFGAAGDEVVIEEFMDGEEASLFALADGSDFVTLITAQDHKAIYEGDKGPNTGGMGAYAPAPLMTPARIQEAREKVIRPVLDEMQRLGCPFKGVLYCGLMLTAEGPRVVEFNCRFGDPEAQVVLPLLKTDLVDIMEAACESRLGEIEIENRPGAAVCVVLASAGYPDASAYKTGKKIAGLDNFCSPQDLLAFHAGTRVEDGQLVTAGGRVLGITALAADISTAVRKAYEGVDQICFDNLYCRRDIAHRALERLQ